MIMVNSLNNKFLGDLAKYTKWQEKVDKDTELVCSREDDETLTDNDLQIIFQKLEF